MSFLQLGLSVKQKQCKVPLSTQFQSITLRFKAKGLTMKIRTFDLLLALTGGALLAVMINLNSALATFSSPLFASWMAHGIGALVALILVALYANIFGNKPVTTETKQVKAPVWSYFGGLPGALTVILAAITVNSSLGLSGTLALGLVGQILFGLVSDHFGLFGLAKKRFAFADILIVMPVLAGSFILIFVGV
jgi:transporter family-2 protein